LFKSRESSADRLSSPALPRASAVVPAAARNLPRKPGQDSPTRHTAHSGNRDPTDSAHVEVVAGKPVPSGWLTEMLVLRDGSLSPYLMFLYLTDDIEATFTGHAPAPCANQQIALISPANQSPMTYSWAAQTPIPAAPGPIWRQRITSFPTGQLRSSALRPGISSSLSGTTKDWGYGRTAFR